MRRVLRRSRRLAVAAVVLGIAVAAFAAFGRGSGTAPAPTRAAYQSVLDSPGDPDGAGEMPTTAVEQFWQSRLTYPTGRFDQRWALAAEKQVAQVPVGTPAGHYRGAGQ